MPRKKATSKRANNEGSVYKNKRGLWVAQATIGYDENGEAKEVYFTKSGSAEDYYAPGTYIKVSTSKTITVGLEVVDETDVPQAALNQIQELGTRPQ